MQNVVQYGRQQTLIVLDNAVAEAQVTPLLPGAAGCLGLVTSRRRMAGLDHTHTLSLDTLPPADAVTLLTRTTSESQLAGQPPELLTELVELCGRLPLAIRIAAARLRLHPTWQVTRLVEQLRDRQQRLSELHAGQRSVTAALDLSYQHLDSDQQWAYRLLGLHPGPDIDAYATAALLDATKVHATRLLDQLLEAHLLQEPTPGRYRFHDLIRVHAAHAAASHDPGHASHTALQRLFGYYRSTASAAMDTAHPYDRDYRPRVPPAHTPSPELIDPPAALAWLDTELSNLLDTARYATEHQQPGHVLHMSTVLQRHLDTRARYHDAEILHRQALLTARAADNPAGHLAALTALGHIQRRQREFDRASEHYGQALRLARAIGHSPGELDALVGLDHLHRLQGRHAQATDHYGQALRLAALSATAPAS